MGEPQRPTAPEAVAVAGSQALGGGQGSPAVLRVVDLRVEHAGVPAVHGVSLEVPAESITAIIGGNGAGKSSILRAIAGLTRPAAGEIWLDGRRLDRLAPHEVVAAGVALVPEGRLIFGRLTVEQNLVLGAFTNRDRAERRRILEEVFILFPRLRERRRQVAGTLSGGEQQMLAIGRALMGRPRVLLLDEPSLGLMPLLVRALLDQVERIRQRGITVLLVEQNVHEALRLADRAYVLQSGRIVASGTGRELLDSPAVRRAYLGM